MNNVIICLHTVWPSYPASIKITQVEPDGTTQLKNPNKYFNDIKLLRGT